MWVIEKTGEYICGIFAKEPLARKCRASLGRSYRLRKLKVRKFPFHIVETGRAGKRKFTYWQEVPEFVDGQDCIDYVIKKPWQPRMPGADEMGILDHAHHSYWPNE